MPELSLQTKEKIVLAGGTALGLVLLGWTGPIGIAVGAVGGALLGDNVAKNHMDKLKFLSSKNSSVDFPEAQMAPGVEAEQHVTSTALLRLGLQNHAAQQSQLTRSNLEEKTEVKEAASNSVKTQSLFNADYPVPSESSYASSAREISPALKM